MANPNGNPVMVHQCRSTRPHLHTRRCLSGDPAGVSEVCLWCLEGRLWQDREGSGTGPRMHAPNDNILYTSRRDTVASPSRSTHVVSPGDRTVSWHLDPSDTSMLKLIRYTCRVIVVQLPRSFVCIGEHLVCMLIAEGYVAEWLGAWDTLTMFEATEWGRSWVRFPAGAIKWDEFFIRPGDWYGFLIWTCLSIQTLNLFRTLSSWGSGNYRPSAPFLYEVASQLNNCLPAIIIVIIIITVEGKRSWGRPRLNPKGTS